MSSDKSNPADPKGKSAPAQTTPPKSPAAKPPPLFRRLDWITFGVTTLFVFIGYWLTLAPDLTLEDSGELAVGSYYAGVPHPPGYPVWTIYTWLFTLIPLGNVAWRVALSSAVAAAFACGLLALMVSRGGSLLIESITEFKNIERRWESALCFISGFVAGALLGFNGFMWSQAVIVEVYTLSVLSFIGVLCSLMRWIYAPQQRRYLYWTFFWFGICFTNHQTLIVAAIGLEVAILAAQPRLGRDLFIGNSIAYLAGLILKSMGILTAFDTNLPLFMIYNLVGLGSIAVAIFMSMKLGRPLTEWKSVLLMLVLWVAGASFYFYMPIASMTNPPLNWGYPRTVEGFNHALTRGQYEQTNPTSSIGRFGEQVWMYVEGAINEFSLVYLLLGIGLLFFFYKRMQKRERAWVVGLTAVGKCLAFLLLILLNPNTDLQSRTQARVFFTASHIILAIFIGYGITLLGGLLATQYQRFRSVILWCAAAATGIELYYIFDTFASTQLPTIRYAAIVGFAVAVGFTGSLLVGRHRAIMPVFLALFALMPARSILSHWADNEQRGHLFGYWFGHDMFTPPFEIYPEMARDAVLFGGTDPGRFNPTYMIFCESFTAPRNKRDPDFDRRDVYLITQNALADKTYLDYIRAHYNRSTQQDPYFFSELFRTERQRDEHRRNILSSALLPLDYFFTNLGARIEATRRDKGVYPPSEIHTPSNEESQECFNDYIMDAARRLQHDTQFPNEPKQVKPGEAVNFTRDGRVQVSGQVAVMSINALLTKVIFDKNPDHEFYLEESFPLDWMFPHLEPFGIIMKINRQPLQSFPEEVLKRDHEFWARYSERLIGNWITYDSSVKDICDFAERTYLRHDFTGFQGDRKFVRDDFAQKAFSKLRSAIGGVYWWRLGYECPPEYRPKTVDEQQRLMKEADFALRQAYAFCPYSPEALHKYVTLLLQASRVQDALLVAETSLKFDPTNPVFVNYAEQLRAIAGSQTTQYSQAQQQFSQIEQQFRDNPNNLPLGLQLVTAYMQLQRFDALLPLLEQLSSNTNADVPTLISVAQTYSQLGQKLNFDRALQRLKDLLPPLQQRLTEDTNNIPLAFQIVSALLVTEQTNRAVAMVDELVARPQPDANTLLSAATVYNQVQQWPKLEHTLERLVALIPGNPEAWYDLAAAKAAVGKTPEAIQSLQTAIQLSRQRQPQQPGAKDLKAEAANDLRFASLRQNPEFQKLLK